MLICPRCNEKLEKVVVLSECKQFGYVDEDNNIRNYSSVENIFETIAIECEHCGQNLMGVVKENG